jgi:hypothetical protein
MEGAYLISGIDSLYSPNIWGKGFPGEIRTNIPYWIIICPFNALGNPYSNHKNKNIVISMGYLTLPLA